jgi:8-amino-7-oxononanoate synthase
MPRGSSLEDRVRARLDAWRAQGLTRTLRVPSGIDLSSNDYLSLSSHPRLVRGFIDAARREGCGSTGSRLLRGERKAFEAVEARFAAFKGTERALFFGAGYLANLGVLTTLAEPEDVIFSDAANHASLIDGVRLSRARRVVYPHNDLRALAGLLEADDDEGTHARFVVVESLFSMDGDIAPLKAYADLCRASGATLVVDEAHAVGVFGARGSGLLEEAGVDANACVSINTAGKALGVSGAFVAGRAWMVDYLVQRARTFVFSTAPPPALAGALDASLSVVADEPDRRVRLQANAARLRDRLSSAGLDVAPGVSHIVPIVLGDNDRTMAVADRLQQQGFDVRAIRPPSVPTGTSRLRVSVNADLSFETLDRFAEVLMTALQEAGLCSAVSS